MDDHTTAVESQPISSDTVESNTALEPTAPSQNVFQTLQHESDRPQTFNDIDFISDIPVQLTVQLGQAKMSIKQLLQLTQGAIVELNGLAGEPLDVFINGCLIAQGEVVVVNERFGIRLMDIITPAERIRKLNK